MHLRRHPRYAASFIFSLSTPLHTNVELNRTCIKVSLLPMEFLYEIIFHLKYEPIMDRKQSFFYMNFIFIFFIGKPISIFPIYGMIQHVITAVCSKYIYDNIYDRLSLCTEGFIDK